MTIRTEAETKFLREEAEKLVRMNWRRTEISRLLEVPLHTLAKWAFEGGWRHKDIAAEGQADRIAALREKFHARQRDQTARDLCGRSAGSLEVGQLEYKSADFEDDTPPPDARPDTRYPASDPDYGPWAPTEKLPKFLTRGGDPNERVCWAAPQLWARTPPWSPGNEVEEPELASLWLAEDLMRQGLLVEAERALRWTKNWLAISRQVFDKQNEEEARRLEYQQQQEQERAREKARRKALGLPDPAEEFEAQITDLKRNWKNSSNNNNSATTSTAPAAAPHPIDVS